MVDVSNNTSLEFIKSDAIIALDCAVEMMGGQDSLASLLNVTHAIVSQWRAGEIAMPEVHAQRIRMLLGANFTPNTLITKQDRYQKAPTVSANYSTIPKEGNMQRNMKKLFVSIRKGGVGKSTVTGQLATYAHSLGLKVMVIDFDDQGGNISNFLIRGKVATRMEGSTSDVLFGKQFVESMPDFAFIPADMRLTQDLVERATTESEYEGQTIQLATLCHQHFEAFLKEIEHSYDLCIIDGPPSQDIRVTMALALSDYVISPIQLAQESLEGMRDTLSSSRGVLRIKGTVNPGLDFLGFLPNQVKSSPKQREALQELGRTHGQYFLRDVEDRLMLIPERESIRTAQGAGVSLQALVSTNSGARETWPRLRHVLDRILSLMQLDSQIEYIDQLRQQQKSQSKSTAKIANLYNAQPVEDTVDLDSALNSDLESLHDSSRRIDEEGDHE